METSTLRLVIPPAIVAAILAVIANPVCEVRQEPTQPPEPPIETGGDTSSDPPSEEETDSAGTTSPTPGESGHAVESDGGSTSGAVPGETGPHDTSGPGVGTGTGETEAGTPTEGDSGEVSSGSEGGDATSGRSTGVADTTDGSTSDEGGTTGGEEPRPSPPPPPPPSPVTARIETSRSTCKAPCTVLFRATSTTVTGLSEAQIWTDLGWHWGFGDGRSGTWIAADEELSDSATVTGRSRNEEFEVPVALHTYYFPGIYRPGVRAGSGGFYGDAYTEVEVTDGSRMATVCVSRSGDFTGCPDGSSRLTAAPSIGQWSDLRVLFHAGETFPGICIGYTDRHVLVSSYGETGHAELGDSVIGVLDSCSDFVPDEAEARRLNALTGNRWAHDITLANLGLTNLTLGLSVSQVDLVGLEIGDENSTAPEGVLMLNQNEAACIAAGTCGLMPYSRGIYLVDSRIRGSRAMENGSRAVNVFGNGGFAWVGIAGNDIDRSGEHALRIQDAQTILVAYNRFHGQHFLDSNRADVTLRSDGFGVSDSVFDERGTIIDEIVFRTGADQFQLRRAGARQAVVYRNIFGGPLATTSSPVGMASVNNLTNGYFNYGTVLRNQFRGGRNGPGNRISMCGSNLRCGGHTGTPPSRQCQGQNTEVCNAPDRVAWNQNHLFNTWLPGPDPGLPGT